LSNCPTPLQSCGEKIATIKRNRTAQTSTEIEQYPRSYRHKGEERDKCLTRPGGHFRVLAHPSNVPVVKMSLPPIDATFAGWGSNIAGTSGRQNEKGWLTQVVTGGNVRP
jgi:hypothetical protein